MASGGARPKVKTETVKEVTKEEEVKKDDKAAAEENKVEKKEDNAEQDELRRRRLARFQANEHTTPELD